MGARLVTPRHFLKHLNMTVRDFYNNLTEMIAANPEVLDYTAVYAKDDEGNAFYPVYHSPTIGQFDEEDQDFSDLSEDFDGSPNALCIN